MSPKSFRRGNPEAGCAVMVMAVVVFVTLAAIAAAVWAAINLFGG